MTSSSLKSVTASTTSVPVLVSEELAHAVSNAIVVNPKRMIRVCFIVFLRRVEVR